MDTAQCEGVWVILLEPASNLLSRIEGPTSAAIGTDGAGGCMAEPVKFLSQAWADQFRSALNSSSSYRDAAAAWEGEILLLVVPDEISPKGEGIYLDLARGECRKAEYISEAGDRACEFVYQGKRSDWARLLHREIDPVKSLFDGTFRIKGNLAKLLRFNRAAKELVESVAGIPAEI